MLQRTARRERAMSEAAWSPVGARMPEPDQLRLLAQVARMYHERGLKQPEIAAELHVSQPRVSRLLKQAVELGIVRTVVTLPPGVHTDLEDEVRNQYSLRDVVVVDAGGAGDDVIRALGAAAAQYLDATLTGGEVIGISSWSETLLSAVESLRPQIGPPAEQVVQLVGGVGNPQVQVQATRLASRLAEMTGAQPVFLPAPGLVSSPDVRRALMDDTSVAAVGDAGHRGALAPVGVGTLRAGSGGRGPRRGGSAAATPSPMPIRRSCAGSGPWVTSATGSSTGAASLSAPASTAGSGGSRRRTCAASRAGWASPVASGSSPP